MKESKIQEYRNGIKVYIKDLSLDFNYMLVLINPFTCLNQFLFILCHT